MNKLTLPCLKSLVQTRPKGDWGFLTQLIQVWPWAKNYYWDKQGYRDLLGSWPFTDIDSNGRVCSRLWLPEGKVFHGMIVEPSYRSSFVHFCEQGKPLLTLFHNHTLETFSLGTQTSVRVWIHSDTADDDPILLIMNPPDLHQQYQEQPMLLQTVLRALSLARDLGKTEIKTLNALAALTCKA